MLTDSQEGFLEKIQNLFLLSQNLDYTLENLPTYCPLFGYQQNRNPQSRLRLMPNKQY